MRYYGGDLSLPFGLAEAEFDSERDLERRSRTCLRVPGCSGFGKDESDEAPTLLLLLALLEEDEDRPRRDLLLLPLELEDEDESFASFLPVWIFLCSLSSFSSSACSFSPSSSLELDALLEEEDLAPRLFCLSIVDLS